MGHIEQPMERNNEHRRAGVHHHVKRGGWLWWVELSGIDQGQQIGRRDGISVCTDLHANPSRFTIKW